MFPPRTVGIQHFASRFPSRHTKTQQLLEARGTKHTSRARWIFLANAHRLSWRTRAEAHLETMTSWVTITDGATASNPLVSL